MLMLISLKQINITHSTGYILYPTAVVFLIWMHEGKPDWFYGIDITMVTAFVITATTFQIVGFLVCVGAVMKSDRD